METTTSEIADGIYRFSTYVPEGNFMFNQFLVQGEEPLLFHTGPRQMFPLVSDGDGRGHARSSSCAGSRSVTSRPTSAAR